LKYMVAAEFYGRIKTWNSKSSGDGSCNADAATPANNSKEEMLVSNYLSEIEEYIAHREEKKSISKENSKDIMHLKREIIISNKKYSELFAMRYTIGIIQ
jgi:hypothetical protein